MSTTYTHKLPAITAAFWIMKICATTLGETAGDLLSMTLKIGYAASSLLLLGMFIVTFSAQLAAKKFHPFLYWLVILTTSTAGTTMSDYLDRTLGLGYATGALFVFIVLLVELACWLACEKSISVNKIRTRRAEIFYWVAILISNTLGTALGDYLSDDSGLGFAGSAALISGLLALLLTLYYATRISRTVLFWLAFVLTRPLGATMGDLLTKTQEKGGFDLGTQGSSLVLLSILLIVILATQGGRQKEPAHE